MIASQLKLVTSLVLKQLIVMFVISSLKLRNIYFVHADFKNSKKKYFKCCLLQL